MALAARSYGRHDAFGLMRMKVGVGASMCHPGKSEFEVQTAPSLPKSISRVKVTRVGSGYTVKRSVAGLKLISVSDAVPHTHTVSLRRSTFSAYGVSAAPVGISQV